MTELNRRTLLKGAAWSVPVVAIAASVPLAAASTVPVTGQLRFIGTPHKPVRELKLKVQNKGSEMARNVTILITGPSSATIPLGDIQPNGLGPTDSDHIRIPDLPDGKYTVTVSSENIQGETISVTLKKSGA